MASAPAERASVLARMSEGDDELCQEAERLLAAHDKSGDFIEQPAFELPRNCSRRSGRTAREAYRSPRLCSGWLFPKRMGKDVQRHSCRGVIADDLAGEIFSPDLLTRG